MIDDLESNIMQEDNIESTSNKFSLKRFDLPFTQQNINILSISVSKKFIFLVTENSELLRIDSETLEPIHQAYSIESSSISGDNIFQENFTKIWTDREGNHSIIRYNDKIYYFNSLGSIVKELNSFKNIEVCAIGFDDRNDSPEKTNSFLVTDYNNNIYEGNIIIDKINSDGDYQIKDTLEKLATLNFTNWDNEDDDDVESKRKDNDRIYGIKFFKATKENIDKEKDDSNYIIIVTKNKFYQLRGPGSLKQIFGSYGQEPTSFNDSCKYFPLKQRRKVKFKGTDLDILYKTETRNKGENKSFKFDVFHQFGWKTETGYCFGQFVYDHNSKSTGLPFNLSNFNVIPFAKITDKGLKETGDEPISVIHTINHIFILYKECLSIISKLTSNIINTVYFQTEFHQIVYDEFAKDNGVILLISKNGLYQISLKDENSDIWKDYLEVGDYLRAQNFCDSEKLKKKINRLDAELEFDQNKDGKNAANKFANSDEKFEIICLKYLMKNDFEGLNLFLEIYKNSNLQKDEEKNPSKDKLQLSLISTWLLEIFINHKNDRNKSAYKEEYRKLIRQNKNYFNQDLIYQMLQNYGKIDEFIEFASTMGDFEKVISYYINQGEIDTAIKKITWFASFDDKAIISKLTEIFLENCNIFFKENPIESITLIQQRFKTIKMGTIIQAIMNTTINEKNNEENKNKIEDKEKDKKDKNSKAILSFLKSLIQMPKIEEKNNIHNLYIYYLSKNKENQKEILEYLEAPLKIEEDQYNGSHRVKEVYFQLDYAKKIFKDNPPAYALVLALMGKYTEAVQMALMQKDDNECQNIAKFIASNAPGEKLRKKLWTDIFSSDDQNEFQQSLNIIKESKILKIEDVLPHLADSINMEEFKGQIAKCINEYESNIKKLKQDINDYNRTAENIRNDIYRVKKKSLEIEYTECKCDICQGYFKDKNVFLFPCGHMFDMDCIRNCLLDLEATGLDEVHKINVKIDDLFFKLGYTNKKMFRNKNDKKEEPEKETETETETDSNLMEGIERTATGFISKLNDLISFKKPEIQKEKTPSKFKELEDELNDILSSQCVLCGDLMVDSIQCSLYLKDYIEPDKDGLSLRIDKEPEFNF